jgi:hypothetical protein
MAPVGKCCAAEGGAVSIRISRRSLALQMPEHLLRLPVLIVSMVQFIRGTKTAVRTSVFYGMMARRGNVVPVLM